MLGGRCLRPHFACNGYLEALSVACRLSPTRSLPGHWVILLPGAIAHHSGRKPTPATPIAIETRSAYDMLSFPPLAVAAAIFVVECSRWFRDPSEFEGLLYGLTATENPTTCKGKHLLQCADSDAVE